MSDTPDVVRFGVIMAGGAGERFWPLSRRLRPKQLLTLTHPDRSLLQIAVDHLLPTVPAERIYIITGTHLQEPIRQASVGIPDENVIAEPCKRNTGGALAYATAHLMARHPELTPDRIALAITTADHAIKEPDVFSRMVDTALYAAETEDALVVCGIVPRSPHTGFGYIQIDGQAPAVKAPEGAPETYRVRAFHEKPDLETAEQFVASGQYFWNSGMFFWKASTFLSELDQARPSLADATRRMAVALAGNNAGEAARLFEKLDNVSIDYALMEKARRVRMVCGVFPWADVGSIVELQEHSSVDDVGNCLSGDPIVHDVRDSIVYNAAGAERMAVAVVGVEGLAVVVTEDAVLVIPKARAQEVRCVVEQLKARNAPQV